MNKTVFESYIIIHQFAINENSPFVTLKLTSTPMWGWGSNQILLAVVKGISLAFNQSSDMS